MNKMEKKIKIIPQQFCITISHTCRGKKKTQQDYQKRNSLCVCILLLMFAKGNGFENFPPMLNSASVVGQK